jgi:hypothetical protein
MLYVIGEREADGVRCPVFALHDEMHFGAGLAQEDVADLAQRGRTIHRLVQHSGQCCCALLRTWDWPRPKSTGIESPASARYNRVHTKIRVTLDTFRVAVGALKAMYGDTA